MNTQSPCTEVHSLATEPFSLLVSMLRCNASVNFKCAADCIPLRVATEPFSLHNMYVTVYRALLHKIFKMQCIAVHMLDVVDSGGISLQQYHPQIGASCQLLHFSNVRYITGKRKKKANWHTWYRVHYVVSILVFKNVKTFDCYANIIWMVTWISLLYVVWK